MNQRKSANSKPFFWMLIVSIILAALVFVYTSAINMIPVTIHGAAFPPSLVTDREFQTRPPEIANDPVNVGTDVEFNIPLD